MFARLVTGYVPIPNHPRIPSEYGHLGELLGGVPVPKKAFYQRVEDTWLWQYVKSLPFIPRVSQGDNPAKNTLAYHCVNHEKTAWLRQAADEYPDTDVFVWVDYGIFHQSGVCNEAIHRFMGALDGKHIYAPGCWDKPMVVESANPCWRFCGSVLAVPRRHIDALDRACKTIAKKHIAHWKNIEFEVNTWARAERDYPQLQWEWYKADHNVTMFDNFPTHTPEKHNDAQ